MILMKSGILLVLALLVNLKSAENLSGSILTTPLYHDTPCNDTDDIISYFSPGLSDGYDILINRTLTKGTQVRLKFDLEAMITEDKDLSRLVTLGNNVFKLVLLKDTTSLKFVIRGQYSLLPPYIVSIKIKGEENCNEPDPGYFQRYPVGVEPRPDVPNLQCGRRQGPNQLITNGFLSKPGDWPWHVAIFRMERATLKYICGGTLISNTYVLTAAHCVTINSAAVLPESLGINLGKHNLIGGNANSQERGVYEVFVHEEFIPRILDNDIALLKMSSAVEFNSNIQPACIWFDKLKDKLPSYEVIGTVTGWGFDQTETLSTVLREATIPMIPDLDCIRSKPLFYATTLNGKKFCAGNRNGTSPCNGDSGGGFVVYVPYEDSNFVKFHLKGAWYVRGIVSLSVAKLDTALCDPNEYVVFTDIGAYTDWINDHMD
nr:chymotrypsin-C-like [Vanessa tameamea]